VARIAGSSHGESRLRMLRVVRRGDRHDPRDLTISFRFEGEFSAAFLEGRSDILLPGEAIKNLVHSTARLHGAGEIETLALALCAEALSRQPRITRARVEIAEERWQRLEAGGKAQPQVFIGGTGERRTANVTSNGTQVSVVAGIERLTLMRSAGFASQRSKGSDDEGLADGLQRLLVGDLTARWTYTSGDVTFGPYRHGVRNAILDTVAWHDSRSVQHALYAAADVILTTYEEIADVTLSFRERPYRLADPFATGAHPDVPDDLFVAVNEPLGIVEVTVERT
jgi:urate oxidase